VRHGEVEPMRQRSRNFTDVHDFSPCPGRNRTCDTRFGNPLRPIRLPSTAARIRAFTSPFGLFQYPLPRDASRSFAGPWRDHRGNGATPTWRETSCTASSGKIRKTPAVLRTDCCRLIPRTRWDPAFRLPRRGHSAVGLSGGACAPDNRIVSRRSQEARAPSLALEGMRPR
jgi:hypothetical protein